MKTWWTEKGWPWLKGNWWVLLLLPLMALVAIGMIMMRVIGSKTVVVDPTREADERARLEAETRTQQLEAEKTRLAAEVRGITAERDRLRSAFETELVARTPGLRDDPEKLREMMLRVGRGEPR